MSALTEPRTQDPDTGSPDDHAHYFRKEDIGMAYVEGTRIKALCGVECVPIRDPNQFPTCEMCKRLLDQLDQRGMS